MKVPLPARLLLTMALAVSAAWPSPGIAAAAATASRHCTVQPLLTRVTSTATAGPSTTSRKAAT